MKTNNRFMNLKVMLLLALVIALSASAMAQIPDYNLPQNWMCHPVLKTTDVARQYDLKLSVLNSDTSHKFDTIYPNYTDTLVDIFYMYPTINMDRDTSNTAIADIDTAVAQFVYREQAGIYSQYGRVFAPYYKQATLGVFLMHDLTEPDKLKLADYIETAYMDIEAAFDNYLQNYNKGHKIILIGHSQGSDMMRFLLHRRFDNNPVLKSQLVVALSGGEPNYAATDGSRTGGSLEHIKTLDSSLPLESGCIISWRSWKNGNDVTPIDAASIFYNQYLVDKGLLYQTYDTVNNRHSDSNYDFGYSMPKLVTRYISMSPDSTQYWGFDDMFGAQFISALNKPGCTYLMIENMPIPMDLRVIPNPIEFDPYNPSVPFNPLSVLFPSLPIPEVSNFPSPPGPYTNYHCWDMQFVQGDLLNLLPELIAITIVELPIIPKRYVTVTGAGIKDGSSWADAQDETQLQAAIDGTGVTEVWVAKGTYNPTLIVSGTTDRDKTFRMKEGVAIYGGFAGTETSLNERSNFGVGSVNETILSGDINGDDVAVGSGATLAITYNTENCYNVINNNGLTSAAVLDGFTITGGNAESNSGKGAGGGMNNYNASPTLANLTVINNVAAWGAGIYNNYQCNLIITNSSIVNNYATIFGGGMSDQSNSSPILTNVLISGNSGGMQGGGICNWEACSPILNNVTISDNSAGSGGGVYNTVSSTPILNNCIIWGNTSTYSGSQIYSDAGCYSIVNNSCYGNISGYIEGSLLVTNNIASDPQFVDAANGDYRIYGISPCADAGNDSYNSQTNDIRGTGFGRKLNKTDGLAGTIDIGAYEFKFATDSTTPCINPVTGGIITDSQSDCVPFDAAEITGLTQPDGYSGTLEYQWQISTDSIAFVTIEGATSETYDPGLISGSAWYKRLARVGCKADWGDAAESNVVKMAIVAPAIEVTATAGNTTPTQYATLKSAFDNINNGIHRGAITVKIIGNTFEPATAVLYQSGHSPYLKFPKGSDYFSVNIYPVVTGLTISGKLDAPLIDLNGADSVTLNGSLNGLNAGKDLTIINTSFSDVAGTSTIRFINDAVADTVRYCTLKGSSNNANAGVVFFSTTNGTRGNDSIVILNNDITSPDPLNRPVNAIYSLGIQAVDMDNSANIISHNNIFDFANKSVVTVQHYTNGILLEGSNMDWKISDNSFYETGPYNTFEETTVTCINVASKSGNTVSISGNFIGGSGSECSGMWWDNADGNISFRGIALITGSSKASSIQGNTIRNFYNRSSNEVPWSGILIGNGDANIGTIAGNMIGDTTGTGSIIIESVLGGDSYAIFANESENVRIENNNIGSFMILSDKEKTLNFTGIFSMSNGNTNTVIRNNQVGSLSDARNIHYFNPESDENQQLIGIFCQGSLSDSISGNIVSGFNSITSDTSANNESLLYGIVDFSYDASVISENRISNLTTNSSLPGDAFFPSVSGIIAFANRTQTISNNTITNLSNTNPDQLVSVKGLLLLKIDASEDTISGNYVGGLSIVSSNGASEVTGLSIEAAMFNKKKSPLSNKLFADFQVNKLSKGSKSANGASMFTTVTNNIINVGDDFAYTYRIAGIYDSTPEYGSRYYFNTVNIGGYPSAGSSDSYAFYLADHSSERDIRNNILVNSRSNEDGFVKNYGLYFGESVPSTGNLALGYNDYYAPGTGGVLAYINGTAHDTLPLVAGQDANSLNIDPAFANAAGITAASLLSSTKTLVAVAGTGITTDYAGLTRSLLYPAMGAWEFDVSPCSNPTNGGIISGSQNGCSPFYPIVITSSELPSGNSGSLEYQWQSSADSLLFTNLVEATSETYEPASLESTTWYKRLSRVDCMSHWTGAAGSNVVKIKVEPAPETPTITRSYDTLTSDVASGNQWYKDDMKIDGATEQEYVAIEDGNYFVIASPYGCSSVASFPVFVLHAGISDLDVSHSFDVYPNPGKGQLNIKVKSAKPVELNIEIFNAIGVLFWKQEKVSIDGTFILPVNLNSVPAGVYFVALRNKNIAMTRKVVIMK